MPDKEKAKNEEKTIEEPAKVVKASPPWPLITIGVFATVVIVAVVIGGWAMLAAHQSERTAGPRNGSMGQIERGSRSGSQLNGHGGMRRGGMMQTPAAAGVITAISGDTLTVAGQGKSLTVKKSDTTTISGDKTSLAVNDTVTVFGTTNSDGTVSATRISVRNETGARVMDDGANGSDDSMLQDSSSL